MGGILKGFVFINLPGYSLIVDDITISGATSGRAVLANCLGRKYVLMYLGSF